MGEMADAMLEGDFCGTCGTALDGEVQGFQRFCSPECEPKKEARKTSSEHAAERRTKQLDEETKSRILTMFENGSNIKHISQKAGVKMGRIESLIRKELNSLRGIR